MSINTILILITLISFTTGIFTIILEKKEVNLQNQSLSESSNSLDKTSSVSDVLTKTLELSSITKKVDVIDLSGSNVEEDYYSEPVIVAVLDDEASPTK